MDIKTISVAFVAIMVGAVAFGAMLPIFQDVTATEDTFTNDGYFRMTKITDTDDDVTVTWDYTKPYIFTVNGVDNTVPTGVTSGNVFPYTLMCSDTWALRFSVTDSGATISLQLYGSGADYIWYINSTSGYNVTCTFESGTFSISREGGAVTTQSYTTAYVIDNTGDYVLKKGNSPAYLHKDSVIYSVGRSYGTFGGTSTFMNVNVQATIEDGATISLIYPTSGYTVTNETIHYSKVTSSEDLYKFSNITFDVVDGSSNTYSAVYGQVIVPYQVTAERTAQGGDGFNTIVDLIPLVIGMGLLLIAVWWFVVRKF